MKDAGNLREGLGIKKIRAEQEALFRGKTLQRAGNGTGQVSEFRCNRGGPWWKRGSIERIERRLAVRSPVMIHMALGERGAKPAKKRTTPGVRSEGRAALSFDLAQAVEF